MSRKTITSLLILLTAILAYAWLSTPESNATPVFTPTPSATPTLPVCVTEDGAGQALCMWDAQRQGNGQGTSVVSGDCAPDIMDGMSKADNERISAECVALHTMPSSERTYQGATITIPNGADLVGECIDINNHANADKAIRNELNNDGWNLTECFKAQRES